MALESFTPVLTAQGLAEAPLLERLSWILQGLTHITFPEIVLPQNIEPSWEVDENDAVVL